MAPDTCAVAPFERCLPNHHEEHRSVYTEIEQTVRSELRPSSQRHTDPEDICQDVFCELLQGISAHDLWLGEPAQLHGLIGKMVRHNLSHLTDYLHAGCRNVDRVAGDPVENFAIESRQDDPSEELARREVVLQFLDGLTPVELKTLELRQSDHDDDQIALIMGRTPEAVRQCLQRMWVRLKRALAE